MAIEDDFKLEQVPAGSISVGDQLAVQKPEGLVLFNVDRVRVRHTPPSPVQHVLVSEPVNGDPWTLTFGGGDLVMKIVRK